MTLVSHRRPILARLAVPALGGLLLLTACTDSGTSGGAAATQVSVRATDTECELSADSAAAGAITFSVTNDGSEVTEFYLYDEDGKKVVGEVEDISPGLSRELDVTVEAGNYITACKPGMSGEGIRAPFEATGSEE